jgi:hypothetical protein
MNTKLNYSVTVAKQITITDDNRFNDEEIKGLMQLAIDYIEPDGLNQESFLVWLNSGDAQDEDCETLSQHRVEQALGVKFEIKIMSRETYITGA